MLRTHSIYDLKLRVAYYARVSTDRAEQQVSIKHQTEHFENLIRSNQNWDFGGAYIDDGISGMHIEKEKNFRTCFVTQKLGKLI